MREVSVTPAGRVAHGWSWFPGGFGFCLPFKAKMDRLSSSKRRISGRKPGTQEAAGNPTGTVGKRCPDPSAQVPGLHAGLRFKMTLFPGFHGLVCAFAPQEPSPEARGGTLQGCPVCAPSPPAEGGGAARPVRPLSVYDFGHHYVVDLLFSLWPWLGSGRGTGHSVVRKAVKCLFLRRAGSVDVLRLLVRSLPAGGLSVRGDKTFFGARGGTAFSSF